MKKVFLTLGLLLLAQAQSLLAASGLASFERLDVTIENGKVKENVTCVKDSGDDNQWYYVPNTVRLAQNSKGEPVFMLVSYQKDKKAGIQDDGALLQCGFNLSLPEGALDTLKKEVIEITNNKKAKLAPLPMKNAQLSIYGPKGDQLGAQVIAPTIGPSFSNECIPVQVSLNGIGTSVLDTLLHGNGGLQVYFIFDYDSKTPEASVKVTADYDKAYTHFSKEEETVKKWCAVFWGGSDTTTKQEVYDSFTQDQTISVETVAGEGLDTERINAIVDTISQKFMDEMFQIKLPDQAVDPAKLGDKTSKRGIFGGSNTNVVIKDQKLVKKGKMVYDLKHSNIVTLKTTVGGFLGLSDIDENERSKYIVTVDPTKWSYAYYTLPTISPNMSGILDINLTINLLYDGKQGEGVNQQTAKWTKKGGWVDVEGNEITYIAFPLKYFYEKHSNDKDFNTKMQFSQKFAVTYMEGNNTKIKEFEDKLAAFRGETPVSTPMSSLTFVEVNGDEDLLDWTDIVDVDDEDAKPTKLTKVAVSLQNEKTKEKAAGTLTTNNTCVGFWFKNEKVEDKKAKTCSYETPVIKGTFTFSNSGYAKVYGGKGKSQIIITKTDALEGGTTIYLDNDFYMTNSDERSFK